MLDSFKADEYGPNLSPVNDIATGAELIPEDNAIEVLEVEIFKAYEQDILMNEGGTSDSRIHKEKRKNTILDPGNHSLRVFMWVTDYVAKQTKLWVGCLPYNGRMYPKIISGDVAFFHEACWDGVSSRIAVGLQRSSRSTGRSPTVCMTMTVPLQCAARRSDIFQRPGTARSAQDS